MRRMGLWLSAGAVALSASLLLARVHPFGDAGLYGANAAQLPRLSDSIPLKERTLLAAKCADCHSMETRAPFYGRFAPVSWMMESDIVQAREHMNLSHWDTYSTDQQQTIKAKIVQETRARTMPPLQYRVAHWNARLTDADVMAMVLWARATTLPKTGSGAQLTGKGDPVIGKEVFQRRCTGCHAMDRDKEGPRLQGVFGRTSGEVAGFSYSAPLKKAHIQWSEKSLDQWLTDPDTLVPGNSMEFHVANAEERQNLISFLKQASGK